jgi:nicotinamide-nucleotide amidase
LKAEIIAVGTELLLGQTANTNARYLSVRLAELGIDVFWHTAVGDNAGRLAEIFRTALDRSDLIIFCGGLGPTSDDLTRETVAGVLGLPLLPDRAWEERLENFFKKLGRPMADINRRQALVPRGADLLVNNHGTAPGLFIEHAGCCIVLLPGPPRELEPLFEQEVMPRLVQKEGSRLIMSRVLKVAGLGESAMAEAVADLIDNQTNPTLAPLAKHTESHLRLTAKAGTRGEAEAMLAGLESKIRERLGVAVYGAGDETLAGAVAKLLLAGGWKLAVAESCTGGLLSHQLTNCPGISAAFLLGTVTYSNAAKQEVLGVKSTLLRDYGAVSEEVARAMAENLRRRSGAGLSLAITGIAGPDGGSEAKPVGLVFVALATPDGVKCRRFNFPGRRETIKERAVAAALNMLRLYLLNTDR